MTGPAILNLQAALSEVSAVAAPVGGSASHQPDQADASAPAARDDVHVYALARQESGALFFGHVSHTSHSSHSSGTGHYSHGSHSSHTSHVSGGHSSHVSGGGPGGGGGGTTVLGRPDLRIAAAGGSMHGDNIYNRLGPQTVAQSGSAGSTLRWQISVQNDAHSRDRIRLHGARSGHGFTVKYLTPDGTNVTHAVEGGTFRTPQLAHGATFKLTVLVKVTGEASTTQRLAGKVQAFSVLTPSKTDTAEFIAGRS